MPGGSILHQCKCCGSIGQLCYACHWHFRNSEIYNHVELKEKYLKGVKIVKDSKSDSAIIGHMYEVKNSSLLY